MPSTLPTFTHASQVKAPRSGTAPCRITTAPLVPSRAGSALHHDHVNVTHRDQADAQPGTRAFIRLAR